MLIIMVEVLDLPKMEPFSLVLETEEVEEVFESIQLICVDPNNYAQNMQSYLGKFLR